MPATQTAVHPSLVEFAAPSRRLLSIDVFRGLLVMGMVLVTNAGSWSYVYWPLKHADWNGVTPTDMIFPSFLFLTGLSMTYSFAARGRRGQTRGQLALHIAERSAFLILLGLFLNGFPMFDWHNLRIPGILQRIGLCYLLTGLLYVFTGRSSGVTSGRDRKLRSNVLVAGVAIPALLVLYWALMSLVPVPGYGVGHLDMTGNLGAYIDRTLMHTNHLWFWGGQTWDPEGLLSTLPAAANMLLGVLAGEWLRSARPASRKLLGLVVVGAVLMVIAVALNPVIPINKKIWTPGFMLFSGGFSLLAVALLHWLIDAKEGLHGWRIGLVPALVFGSNAILGFTVAQMLNPLFGMVTIHDGSSTAVDLPGACFHVFSRFLDTWNASLAYAILFVLLNLAILWPLYSKRIFVRL